MTSTYADQRGHDVAWMTATERAELDQHAAKLGAVVAATSSPCADCGGPVWRVDVPLPAYAAPVPWWHHGSEASARACPGRGPVRPA